MSFDPQNFPDTYICFECGEDHYPGQRCAYMLPDERYMSDAAREDMAQRPIDWERVRYHLGVRNA